MQEKSGFTANFSDFLINVRTQKNKLYKNSKKHPRPGRRNSAGSGEKPGHNACRPRLAVSPGRYSCKLFYP